MYTHESRSDDRVEWVIVVFRCVIRTNSKTIMTEKNESEKITRLPKMQRKKSKKGGEQSLEQSFSLRDTLMRERVEKTIMQSLDFILEN